MFGTNLALEIQGSMGHGCQTVNLHIALKAMLFLLNVCCHEIYICT